MNIADEYFEWLYQIVEGKKYYQLLKELHLIEFYPKVPCDDNRLGDGVNLRYRFADDAKLTKDYIDTYWPKDTCSILEMMVALALRVEETIMGDEDFGNRTSMWFWMMIKSLGIYKMTNDDIDLDKLQEIMRKFLEREYEADGKGGLFTVHNSDKDMRDIEIWYQMCLFFDNLL